MTNSLAAFAAGEVRAEMGRQKITQSELARRVGRTEMYLSRRLNDSVPLDLVDVEAIATALNVAVSRLMPAEIPA